MLEATVVEDHVHHNFQTFGMGLITKAFVIVIGTETGVDLVIIGRGIAVIGREAILLIGGIVLQYRREPKGGDAQLLEIIEVFADTIQVATMT